MSALEIRLLGNLEISHADSVSQLSLPLGCRRLLAYLLLKTGKMCGREELIDVFWGDSTPQRARRCLNSAVWRLRRELESLGLNGNDTILSTDVGEIGFNWACDFWLDAQRFEQQLSSILRRPATDTEPDEIERLERSLSLYRGELLEGLYDDWALVERERFRLMYLNALSFLVDYCAGRGDYERGKRFAQSIVRIDPLREDMHRKLMELHMSVGQRALAVEQFQTCARILARELGVPPMEETQLLHEEILYASRASGQGTRSEHAQGPDIGQQLRQIKRRLTEVDILLRQTQQLMLGLPGVDANASTSNYENAN